MIQSRAISEPDELSYPQIITTDLYQDNSTKFNVEAVESLNVTTDTLIYQYSEITAHIGHMYDVVQLLNLMKLREADPAICMAGIIRNFVKVRNYGYIVDAHRLPEAIDKLISHINDMASNGWIKASFYKLGTMEVHDMKDTAIKKHIIFSYIALTENEPSAVSTYNWLEFNDGSLPVEFK